MDLLKIQIYECISLWKLTFPFLLLTFFFLQLTSKFSGSQALEGEIHDACSIPCGRLRSRNDLIENFLYLKSSELPEYSQPSHSPSKLTFLSLFFPDADGRFLCGSKWEYLLVSLMRWLPSLSEYFRLLCTRGLVLVYYPTFGH